MSGGIRVKKYDYTMLGLAMVSFICALVEACSGDVELMCVCFANALFTLGLWAYTNI